MIAEVNQRQKQEAAEAVGGDAVLRQVLEAGAKAIKRDIAENFRSESDPDGNPWKKLLMPRPDGSTGPVLHKTGGLLAAATHQGAPGHVERYTKHSVEIGVSTDAIPGARIHQLGGVIRPTHGQFLTIPRTAEAERVRARDFPRKLFVLSRNGAPSALAERSQDQLVVHYLLRKSVTIPARPYLGFGRRLLERLGTALSGAVVTAFRGRD